MHPSTSLDLLRLSPPSIRLIMRSLLHLLLTHPLQLFSLSSCLTPTPALSLTLISRGCTHSLLPYRELSVFRLSALFSNASFTVKLSSSDDTASHSSLYSSKRWNIVHIYFRFLSRGIRLFLSGFQRDSEETEVDQSGSKK